MSFKKPLVLDGSGQLQQLQAGDQLDVPLEDRVAALEQKLKELSEILIIQGIEIPDSLTTE